MPGNECWRIGKVYGKQNMITQTMSFKQGKKIQVRNTWKLPYIFSQEGIKSKYKFSNVYPSHIHKCSLTTVRVILWEHAALPYL